RKNFLTLIAILVCLNLNAQFTSGNNPGYDYHALFSPLFYTYNGNAYRSANGEPGTEYWQNKANYRIDAALNEATNAVTATVVLDYKNNSPENLQYLWLQLDQNLFNDTSRGHAKMPATGRSRYGDANSAFKGGFRF